MRVRFVESVRGGTANAQISGSDVLVEKNNPNPVMFLVGHEMTHRMQELAPEAYRAFREIVAGEAQGTALVLLEQYQRAGETISYEAALDEAAANYAGRLMESGEVLDDFIERHRENRTLLEKVRDAIRAIIAKLTGAEKKKAQTAEGKLTAALEAAAKQAERLQGKAGDGTMGAEKHSLKGDYWRPNLTKTEWALLERHMAQEIGDDAHTLDEATKWVYANEKGVQVFALYGVGDGTEATPLYAVGGKRAEVAYRVFISKMEEIENGVYSYGTNVSWWVESVRRNQRNGGGYFDDSGWARTASEKANGLHGRTSGRHTATAAGASTEDSNQVKTKFSLKSPVEETEKLLALHNLNEDSMLGNLDLGGLPMPSIAVVKARAGHSKYGPISLVFNKATIDPQADSRNKVYGGDAWTPTFPRVDYPVNSQKMAQVERELHKLAGDVSVAGGIFGNSAALRSMGVDEATSMTTAELAERLAQTDTARAAYLAEQGKTLEPVKKEKVWNKFGNDTLQKVIDRLGVQELAEMVAKLETGESVENALGENAETIRDILWEYYQEAGEPRLQRMAAKRNWTAEEINAKREARIAANMENVTHFTLEDVVFNTWDMYQDGGATKGEIDRLATSEALRAEVNDWDVERWAAEKLDGLLGEPGIYNGKDLFTPQGNRRSFDALHYEVSLENIVKVMKKDTQKGGDTTFGGNSIWGVATKDYASIQDIKNDSERLGNLSDDEYDALRNSYTQRLADLAMEIRNTQSSDSFFATDDAAEAIVETLRKRRTVASIDKALRSYTHLNIKSDTAEKALALFRDISNMPTGYFEAKPQRAVGFDEVLAAVIPSDSSEKLRAALAGEGVNVLTYESGNEADRLNKVNSVDGARFSLKGTNKYGIEVYETSEEVRKMPYKQRMETFMDIMRNEYAGRTAKFTANGNVYYARFGDADLRKNLYGDKRSDRSGWNAKVRTGADGNIFELVENAAYKGSGAETGKVIDAHKNVTGWEYFVKTVQIDGQVYNLLANVRKKPDGEYVYSIQLNKNKSKAPAPPVARAYTDANAADGYASERVPTNASGTSISSSGEKVNGKFSTDAPDIRRSLKGSEMAREIAELRRENEYLRERWDYWKGQTKRTTRVTTDKEAVAKVAKQLIRDYDADIAVEDIQGDLQNLYDYMASGYEGKDELTYTEARRRAENIAATLVENAVVEDRELYDQYSELRDYLRTTRITLDKAYEHDLIGYENLRQFRRVNAVRIGLPLQKRGREIPAS